MIFLMFELITHHKDNLNQKLSKTKIFYNTLVKKMHIFEGDTVYLASDLIKIIFYLKINKKPFDPNDIINSILNVIGTNGTLIIPSFNWDFCQGKPYDIINSPAQTGSLANFVLKNRVFLIFSTKKKQKKIF